MLEIKTCQPIIAGFVSPSLTLADIKLAIPEATEAHLVSNTVMSLGGNTLYAYYVYAGEVATFKAPGPYGDRSAVAFKHVSSDLEYTSDDTDLVLPTSIVAYYSQYAH